MEEKSLSELILETDTDSIRIVFFPLLFEVGVTLNDKSFLVSVTDLKSLTPEAKTRWEELSNNNDICSYKNYIFKMSDIPEQFRPSKSK